MNSSKLFQIAKEIERYYDRLMSKIMGTYEPNNYNILNPYFLPYHYLNKNVKEFSTKTNGILLDLGCGTKPYADLFKGKIDRYFGIDYKETINMEHLESVSTRDRIPDVWGDIINLPVKPNSVDTVFASMVLEHVSEPDLLIKEIAIILKPGGTLILTTVHTYPLHHDKYDFFRFTKLGLKYLIEKNNLKLVFIKPDGRFYVHIGEMIVHFVHRRLFRNVNGVFWKVLMGFIKILLTPILIVFTFLVNVICLMLNYIDIDETFTTSYALLAKK